MLAIVMLSGCSGDDPVVFMRDNIDNYFPLQKGDTWYYTFYGADDTLQVVRLALDEIELNGMNCTPIYENADLADCWSKNTSGFYVHLIPVRFYPNPIIKFTTEPPLVIPFDMRSDEPFQFKSYAQRLGGGSGDGFDIEGELSLSGFVTKAVPAGTFKNCLALYYDDGYEPYFEYYAPGVGLLDNGEIILDSAVVGGVKYNMLGDGLLDY